MSKPVRWILGVGVLLWVLCSGSVAAVSTSMMVSGEKRTGVVLDVWDELDCDGTGTGADGRTRRKVTCHTNHYAKVRYEDADGREKETTVNGRHDVGDEVELDVDANLDMAISSGGNEITMGCSYVSVIVGVVAGLVLVFSGRRRVPPTPPRP